MLRLLAKTAAGVDDDMLRYASLKASGEFGRRFLTAYGARQALLDAVEDGLSVDEVETFQDQLGQVSAAEVSAVLADCVNHEAISVVGPGGVSQLEDIDKEEVAWRAQAQEVLKQLR